MIFSVANDCFVWYNDFMEENLLRERYLKHLYKVCKNKSLRRYATEFFDDLCEKYAGKIFTAEDFATEIVEGKEVKQDVVVDLIEKQGCVTMPEIYLYLFENNVKSIKYYNRFTGAVEGDNDFVSKKVRVKTYSIKEFYKPSKVMPRSVPYNPDMPKAEYDRLCKIEEKKAKIAQKEENKRAWKQAIVNWKEKHHHVLYHELAHVDELETYGGRKIVGNHFCSDERFVRENDRKYTQVRPTFFMSSAEIDEEDEKMQKPISNEELLIRAMRDGKVAISEIFNEEFACEVEGTLNFQEPNRLVMEITQENRTIFYSRKIELAGNCDYNQNYDYACMVRALLGDLDFKRARFNSKEVIRRINASAIDINYVHARIANLIDKAIEVAPTPEKITITQDGQSKEVKMRGDAEIFEYFKSKLDGMNFYQTLCLCFGVPKIAQASNCKMYQDYIAPEARKITQEILIEAIRANLERDFADESLPKDENFFKRLDQTLRAIDNFILYPYDDVRLRVEGEKEEKYFKSTYLYPAKKMIEDYTEPHVTAFGKLISMAEEFLGLYPDMHSDFFIKQLEIAEKYQEIKQIHDEIIAEEDRLRMERMQRQYEEAVERERLWREEWGKKHKETNPADESDDADELF